MFKNKMAYLGILGIIGLVGLMIGHVSLASFSVFLIFFAYIKIPPDEMFWQQVHKASLRALLLNISLGALIIIGLTVDNNIINPLQGNARPPFDFPKAFQDAVQASSSTIALPLDFYITIHLLASLLLMNLMLTVLFFGCTMIYYNHKERKALEPLGEGELMNDTQ